MHRENLWKSRVEPIHMVITYDAKSVSTLVA